MPPKGGLLMPEWLTITLALLTATGVGGVITAFINKRPTRLDPFSQMQVMVAGIQKERELDSSRIAAQDLRIDELFTQLSLHRTYEIELLAWGAAGGPPPPPKRPDGLK